MSANFTPDMTGYKGLSPFRFWCQKTLPLVYDDSLSYYELLCKVVSYINNLITDVAAAEENVDKLLTAYNQLQEYVNNYFDGADFQQKIDDSLDRYAEDGTLSRMVNTHVSALLPHEVGQQIGPVVDEDLGPVVDLKLPAVVESKIAAPVATQLPAVVQSQIGGVVGNQIGDVVADQIDEVVADQITDAVSPLVHDEVTGLIRPAVSAELPAALQVYLPPEVQTQLPGAIGTDLETIAPPVIEDWLDAHPEATTSVPDGSISFSKLATDLQRRAGIVGTYFPSDFTNEYVWQVNQYAVYQGIVYRCIKTTTAGQAWNASEWTTANMNSDLFYMWWCLNYLSQSITTIDSSPATSAHEAGEYFIYYDGAHLYRLAKASSNIAVGDNLTVNGNFIYSSVANMIADLKVEIADLKSEVNELTLQRTIIRNVMENGQLNSAGQVITVDSRDLYICPVIAGKTLLVQSTDGEVYAFFNQYPAYGVVAISGRLNLQNGINEISVPTGATYIAVRDIKNHTPYIVYKGSIQDRMAKAENDITANTEDIDNLTEMIGSLYDVTYTPGAYVRDANNYAVLQTTGVSAAYKCWIFDCIGYTDIDVITYASSEREIFVTDKDFKIITATTTGASSAIVKTTTHVQIPVNGRKLIIPCNAGNEYDIALEGITVATSIESNKALVESHFPNEADINPCDYTGQNIMVFKKCLCIGDSFTEGGFNADSQDPDNPEGFKDYSYPTVLSRLTGMEVTNMGHGGETAQSWDRTYTNTITGGYDLCIILLGINDCVNYGSFNAESQAALGRIIAKVQSENIHIKIFVSTIPIYPAFDTEAIRASTQIIKDYIESLNDENLYVMDMENNNHLKDSAAYQYGHPTALGYARLAEDYRNYISWIISQNKTEFRFVQFIGTPYTHNTPY